MQKIAVGVGCEYIEYCANLKLYFKIAQFLLELI